LKHSGKAARSVLGQSAIATSVRANHREPDEMEGLCVRLVGRLTHQSSAYRGELSNAVGTVLYWLAIESDIGAPGPEDSRLLAVRAAAERKLKTDAKMSDPGAIVRACFRACG
jgi:hypothetical protein